MLQPELIGQALTIAVVAGLGVINHVRGTRKDRRTGEQLTAAVAELQSTNAASFAQVRSDIAEVRAFCVGPDGENGFRKDIAEIKKRVIGLEDRERARLEETRVHAAYDRRGL